MSSASIAGVADRPQAVCGSYLSCALITLSPSRPSLHSSSPSFLYYFFPPDCDTSPPTACPSPPTFSCKQAHRRFSSRRLADAHPFLFSSSSSSSLRGFRLRLQPATSSSFKYMRALVQILRMLFRPGLKAPAGQCCGTAMCAGCGGRPWKSYTKPKSHTKVCVVANPDQSSALNTCSDGYSIQPKMLCF